ncbi:MAG: hypothetical protein IJ733_17335 [Lachnospiraceae bacterium]|nr:hypothetical protein [Lachnospiraceae bacterium]
MKNRDDALVRRILEYCSEVEDAFELLEKMKSDELFEACQSGSNSGMGQRKVETKTRNNL